MQKTADKGKNRSSSNEDGSDATKVDLVVEDRDAEVMERIRARKDGNPQWNVSAEPKYFV